MNPQTLQKSSQARPISLMLQGMGKCLKSETLGTPCKEAVKHYQGSVVATADRDYLFCVRKANSCFLGLRNKHIFFVVVECTLV